MKVTKKKGYRLHVYSWANTKPDDLTFYYMTEEGIIDWIEKKLSDPSSSVTSVEVEEFNYTVYEK